MTAPALADLAAVEAVVDDAVVGSQVAARWRAGSLERWGEQASSCGFCARPVRLRGSATTVDRATGEVLSAYDSAAEPDGVLYVRCGNRRAAVCRSCSHEYKGDMWHLLAAGAAGGMKGVPTSVAAHPLVFATVTAPGFGPVHTTRRDRAGKAGRCRPFRRGGRLCAHGRPTWCARVHGEDDPVLGQPICADCYDYDAHVVWQWWSPELWRRFTIALHRTLAGRLGVRQSDLMDLVRVSFAKVAEFQRRGVVHFHALIRLDGPARLASPDAPFPAPVVDVDAADLAGLVREAAARVAFDAPPTSEGDVVRRLRFGAQVDARPVTAGADREAGRIDRAGQLHPETVAAYIAKYATKACEDFGLPARLRDPDAAVWLGLSPHVCRIVAACARIARAEASEYLGLGRWLHMLGFRGHFASKSRGYSTTLGRLRSTRRRWRLAQLRTAREKANGVQVVDVDADLAADADEETTLVVGSWDFDGMGWTTAGDAALAAQAAALAREWHDHRATARRETRAAA
ncbi:replication initiator [Thalassiella azotivora]